MHFRALTIALVAALTTIGSSNALTINNANDLIEFSNSVNRTNKYNGTTVLLGSDIDFSEELSQQFKPIGKDVNNYFSGGI